MGHPRVIAGLVSAVFWWVGGYALLFEVAFEVAFAGTMVYRIGKGDTIGDWTGTLVRRTWLPALDLSLARESLTKEKEKEERERKKPTRSKADLQPPLGCFGWNIEVADCVMIKMQVSDLIISSLVLSAVATSILLRFYPRPTQPSPAFVSFSAISA